MPQKKIKATANFKREDMYNLGIRNGLSENAANMFKFFTEKTLVLTVDVDTGEVIKSETTN